MTPRLSLALIAAVASVCACEPPRRDRGLGDTRLDNQVARAIGDPSTCVLLADRRSGQVVYQYGTDFNCVRQLPACDRPGTLNAHQALSLALAPQGRMASCASVPDGSRSVGWGEGPVKSVTGRTLVYSAVMEGERALPGHEINARLFDAFQKAGV